jgi:hypothetical protein
VWFGKRKGQAWRGSMVSSTLGVYPKAADAAKGEMLEIESGKGLKTDRNEAREFAAEISGSDGIYCVRYNLQSRTYSARIGRFLLSKRQPELA